MKSETKKTTKNWKTKQSIQSTMKINRQQKAMTAKKFRFWWIKTHPHSSKSGEKKGNGTSFV